MATITIRTDENIKKALQEKAKQLGLSLNQFINLGFRYILKSDKLVIDFENEDLSEYEKFMKKVEKDMEKEGIKFERLSFEEGRKSFLKNKKKISEFLRSIK